MTKWELKSVSIALRKIDPASIWEEVDKKTGKTDWEELADLAAEGWELVNVIVHRDVVFVYTFKRPIEE